LRSGVRFRRTRRCHCTSDVDFLVEFGPERSLLDQVHLIADLEQLLGARVDVVAEGGLLDRDTHILAEAVAL